MSAFPYCFSGHSSPLSISDWHMPDESAHHHRTWMAFIAEATIWGKRRVPEVHRNLALIAKTIAKYEPVSMLVSERDYTIAEDLLDGLSNHPFPIELIAFDMDDLWIRDTGPTFVVNNKGEKAAIDFNFNGWGNKQEYKRDAQVAKFIAKQAKTPILHSSLVLEGGCIEVDGARTAIMTESCILNDNRNPGKNKTDVESELKQLLGLDKILWLTGIKGKDITDGHTDFYARFARPGVAVVSRDNYKASYDYEVTRENIAELKKAQDANGTALSLIILDSPEKINTRFDTREFAAGYVGYYACNGAIVMQKFGDTNADAKAKSALAKAFPSRVIEQISVDAIASGGGSIHCATQQEPA